MSGAELSERQGPDRATLDLLPLLTFVLSADGAVEYYNAAWRTQVARDEADSVAVGWFHGLHPDDHPNAAKAWTQAHDTRVACEFECRLRNSNGDDIWHLVRIEPRASAAGVVEFWLGTAINIHRRVLQLRALEQHSDNQRDMLNVGADCVAIIDLDGNLVQMNKACCIALGVAEKSVKGRAWIPLLPPEICGKGEEALATARQGHDARFASMNQLPGQPPEYWDNNLVPLRDAAGIVRSILCVSHEVTRQHHAEESLRLSNERLELATRATKLGCFDFRPADGSLEWDDRCRELFCVPPEMPVTYERFLSLVHPNDRERVVSKVPVSLDTDRRGQFEVEYRTNAEAMGFERILLARGFAFFDHGVAVRVVGTVQDVTADRMATRKLAEVEERLTLAVRATNDAIWDWDLGSDHIDWNEAIETSYGYGIDAVEPTGGWWLSKVHPDDRQRISDSIHGAIDGSAHDWLEEYRFQRFDGSYADVRDRGYVLRNECGRAVRMLGAMLDQTDRKAIERNLVALNKALEVSVTQRTTELNRLWDISPDLLLILALDGTIERVNPAWKTILDYDPEDLIGHHHSEFALLADAQIMTSALSEATTASVEVRLVHKDGSIRWVSWVAARTEAEVFANGRHVTAAKEAAVALRQAEDALRQAQKVEAIGKLTGGVAHDFNNLLTVIRGSLDLLRRPNITEAQRHRYLDAIADTTDRAVRVTSQLLAFARRSSLKPKSFDVGANLMGLRGMIGTLTGAMISIDIELPEDPCFVLADPIQFDTAIVNMAVNARDAMKGQGRLLMSVRSEVLQAGTHSQLAAAGEYVAISITDTGSGIPQDSIHQIFEPFFTTKEIGEGTGLGLSQVYGFAKQSGGEVEVESRVDEGTTFTLFLPRVASAPGDLQSQRDENAARPMSASVLVVEDNNEVGTFAVQALAELGHAASLAESADRALALLAAGKHYDVVFSDVVMPGMSGIELGKVIRRLYPRLPVILTSGYSSVLAEQGTHGFELLHKPYSMNDLAKAFERIIAIAASRSGPTAAYR